MERLPKELLIKIIERVRDKINEEYQTKYREICQLLKRTSNDSYSYNKVVCIECRRLNYEEKEEKGKKEENEREENWCITTVPENSDSSPQLEFESTENGGIYVGRNGYYCHKHNLSNYKTKQKQKQELHQLPKDRLIKIIQVMDSEETKKWKSKISESIKYLRKTCIQNSMFLMQTITYQKDGESCYAVSDYYTNTVKYITEKK